MTSTASLNNSPLKLKILFVYEDERAEYLIDELKEHVDLIGILHLEWKKELFFWVNLLLCALKIVQIMIKKHAWTRVSFGVLYHNAIRRLSYIKKMSSKIEKHIKAMKVRPDLVLQWSSMFAPYLNAPSVPFALIIDNYADPPNSSIKKDKLRWWSSLHEGSTLYDNSFYRLQKGLYSSSACVFTFTKWCERGLAKEYNIDPAKIVSVGWGPAAKIEGRLFEKKPKTILAVGHDYLSKGFDILVRSAEYLTDFSITIVGKDSGRSFNGLNIPENVNIMNYVSYKTLIRLYSESELFFLFTEFEPAGHVLWEAQAYGCVIIGYDAYGISEAVIHNKTGILLKTRDPVLIAEQIRKLYQDEIALARMRNSAFQNYIENGTWKVVSEKIKNRLELVYGQKNKNC